MNAFYVNFMQNYGFDQLSSLLLSAILEREIAVFSSLNLSNQMNFKYND